MDPFFVDSPTTANRHFFIQQYQWPRFRETFDGGRTWGMPFEDYNFA